jgi:6,7-dimethyl-8-ribityllumazine synthase
MSKRETHQEDDFEGWPSAAWSGDPDEPPSRREQREAYAREEDASARTAAPPGDPPAAEARPELKPEPEPDAEAEALDISAEHHDDEQWMSEPEEAAPDAAASVDAAPEDAEPEDAESEDAEPEDADPEGAEPDRAEAEAGAEAEAEPEPEPQPADEPEEPEAGAAVLEHAGGELDIPPGYMVLEGEPRGDRRAVGIVVSRFNGGITNRMLETALDALAEAGVAPDAITVMPVPGAFELPLAAMALAKTRRYACIVALGAVIRGGTPHFEFVATEAASGLQLAQIETGVPVAFGVLTCDDVSQAEARIYKSREAVESALEMADVFERLRASAKTG